MFVTILTCIPWGTRTGGRKGSCRCWNESRNPWQQNHKPQATKLETPNIQTINPQPQHPQPLTAHAGAVRERGDRAAAGRRRRRAVMRLHCAVVSLQLRALHAVCPAAPVDESCIACIASRLFVPQPRRLRGQRDVLQGHAMDARGLGL
jgi:hypothetical protein